MFVVLLETISNLMLPWKLLQQGGGRDWFLSNTFALLSSVFGRKMLFGSLVEVIV